MDMSIAAINWLAVVVAAGLTFLIGGLWYSPMLFARRWMALNRLTDNDMNQGNSGAIFGLSFVFALIAAISLAMFLGPGVDIGFGTLAGFLVGATWVATSLATTFLFERRPIGLLAIDAGYHVVTFSLMGAILGAWG
jgi:hypothetical protein